MHLDDIQTRLERLKAEKTKFKFILSSGVDIIDFSKTEQLIGKSLPEKIREFWAYTNGLQTDNPKFVILKIQDFEMAANGLIHFATFNGNTKVYFDTSTLNQANEWFIVYPDEQYIITLTMSSFWANKMWHWLKNGTEIWRDNYWIKK
jgi:hypothetical protein